MRVKTVISFVRMASNDEMSRMNSMNIVGDNENAVGNGGRCNSSILLRDTVRLSSLSARLVGRSSTVERIQHTFCQFCQGQICNMCMATESCCQSGIIMQAERI